MDHKDPDGRSRDLVKSTAPETDSARSLGETAIDVSAVRAATRLGSFEVILASIGDGVIVADTNGKVTFLNPVAQSLTGWSLDDAQGKPLKTVFRIINEETGGQVENPALRAMREGVIIGLANHSVLVAKDGTEIPIDDSGAPVRDPEGSLLGAVLVFRDITARRQNEKARGLLAAIVESSEDAIVSKNRDGVIDSWNSGAEHLFEYPASEAIGRSIKIIVPPDRLDEEELILERLRRGERIEHFETVRVSRSGRLLDIDLTVSPVRNARGEIIGSSKIARDITRRKRAEQERLRLLVSEKEARERAEAASLAKDKFVAQISHELRTPLNSIVGWANLLRSNNLDKSETARALETIESNAKVQVRLIEDLLDLSQVTMGKMNLKMRPVDVAQIIEAALHSIRPAAQAKSIELKTHLETKNIVISGDPDRLQQILWNLLSNAVRFTPRDGHIEISISHLDHHLEIVVSDSGVGISGEFLPFVFDLFSQGNFEGDGKHRGLGLGLAIARHLVELHGGTIAAHSPGEGRGAKFTITFPSKTAVE